ncbi:MAG: cytochrome b5 domain-containing protein [Pseudomonadota bacterium]|nr:cytochrome b5 domain-containing protein [Pseudomonadota bacterium]
MRKIILSAVLLAASVAAHAQTTYTAADVAKHATATDCWMILNTSKVYNFTPYTSLHPGGKASISSACGQQGDAAFASVPHSANAVAIEASYLIGTLGAAVPPISVTVSPSTATLALHATQQFTGTVKGSSSGMTWTVSPANLGTISANGMFTATTAGQGMVTVASQQDQTKSATAMVTVSAATPPPPPAAVTVSVTPSALTLSTNSSHTFVATVTNSTQGVTWTASAAIGKINTNGVLVSAMAPATGTVTATSVQDPLKSASVQVTLTSPVAAPPAPPAQPVPPAPPATCTPGSGGSDDGDGKHHHED